MDTFPFRRLPGLKPSSRLNWSDSIYFEAMPPDLKISPFGDIQTDYGFDSQVVNPLLESVRANQLNQHIKSYEKYFQGDKDLSQEDSDDAFSIFEKAWMQEIGVALQDCFLFQKGIEEIGQKSQTQTMIFTPIFFDQGNNHLSPSADSSFTVFNSSDGRALIAAICSF